MQPCLHFVGFKGDEFNRALRVFGPPAYVHPTWDVRAEQEWAPGDVVVYANGTPRRVGDRDFFLSVAVQT